MMRRPVSPHLQIYKLPLAAIISISHRIVGVGLFTVLIGLGVYSCLVILNINPEWLTYLIFSCVGKMAVSLGIPALIFYALAEIRYIIWGINYGIHLPFTKISNILILSGTLIFSVYCWIILWGVI